MCQSTLYRLFRQHTQLYDKLSWPHNMLPLLVRFVDSKSQFRFVAVVAPFTKADDQMTGGVIVAVVIHFTAACPTSVSLLFRV